MISMLHILWHNAAPSPGMQVSSYPLPRLHGILLKKILRNLDHMYFIMSRQFVLHCVDGVVIPAQCIATFLRSIVFPEFRY